MRALGARTALVVLLLAGAAAGQTGRAAGPSLLKTTLGRLPLYFVENRGMSSDEVAYYIQGADKTLFFTRDGITFRLKGKDRAWVVKLEFVGANPEVVPRGEDRQQAVFSYFRGPETDWKTGLRTYSKVVYRDLWPGVDLVYMGTVNRLKYEFVVAPGADPARIRLRYRGVASLTHTDSGALRVETPEGSFDDAPPTAWQEIGGKRVPVDMRYQLDPGASGDTACFGFDVGDYERTRPLILDPAVIVYCGYIGGNQFDESLGIAMDAAGNAYVTGMTESSEATFPVRVGPDLTSNHYRDAFVAKVNAVGAALVYCGFIGGNDDDGGEAIAVDSFANAYVTGSTRSDETSFPVKVGPDLTHNGGSASYRQDAFVAKVNASGTNLVYCGYIGGEMVDAGKGIAVDRDRNAYVTGWTWSDERTFPVTLGPDLTHNGSGDAFVAKVSSDGTRLVYCGYIGGSRSESGQSIAVDRAGSAYIAGDTDSDEQTFPVTVGPDLTFNGGWGGWPDEAFVAKLNPAGTALAYCGYIGGSGDDVGEAIAVDRVGNAYVTGWTGSDEKTFPVTVGPDLTFNGGSASWPYDAFVAKVNAAGSAFVYCGYIGGNDRDHGNSVAVDRVGNAYVTGWTGSDEKTFPVTVGPDLTFNGGSTAWPYDAFVAKVNVPGNALVYCGYIGGAGGDLANGIAVDAAGNLCITGSTDSTPQSFPVTVGPGLVFKGGSTYLPCDAFVAKVALLDDLTGSGTPRPGGTIALVLTAVEVRGLSYQLGTSLGTGPIPIDTRRIDLSPDDLLTVTVSDYWPSVFSSYRGVIDNQGRAQATIHIPNLPALIGRHLHTAFVTLDPQAPSGVRSISNTFSFQITQ